MFLKTKNRKALSAVLTTLIILVASVVLGTGVVLFGTSLFQTNSQSSSLDVQGVHVWLNSKSSPTYAWGAAQIRNGGDKILSVDQISVRGSQIPYSNWYVDSSSADVTAANFQSQLNYTTTTGTTPAGMMGTYITVGNYALPTSCQNAGGSFAINEYNNTQPSTAPTLCFVQATGPISLKPGAQAIVYFEMPTGLLNTVDGGSVSNVAVYAGNVGAPQSITIQSQPN